MLAFDEARHEYRWNGVLVPNVTRILGPLVDYSHIPADRLEVARQQGVAIHRMVELDCQGSLDVAKMHSDARQAWMRGHYEAWQRFLDDSGFECWASERRMFHEALQYAGTLDLVGLAPKLKRGGPVLIDVKRSFYAGAAIGYQTIAYLEAWNRAADKAMRAERRFALRLDGDGKYRLTEFADRGDYSVFLACLTIHRARVTLHATQPA